MSNAAFAFIVNGLPIGQLVAIDGGFKWASNDIHDEKSGRTMDGVMHVYRIASKDQIDVSCVPMSQADAASLLTALKQSEEFSVTYESPETGAPRTATFYCPARNCEFLAHIRGMKWWQHVKFTLTEC